MNNDLISRKALKAAMWHESHFITTFTGCGTEEARLGLTFSEIEQIINNAKPVITDSLYEAYCEMNDEEFEHTESFTVKTPKGKIVKFVKERPQSENIPFTSLSCPSCGNSMWGYENRKIICAVCGNTMTDMICKNCDSGYAQGYSDGYLKGKEADNEK